MHQTAKGEASQDVFDDVLGRAKEHTHSHVWRSREVDHAGQPVKTGSRNDS
jgi:hypothetical protein